MKKYKVKILVVLTVLLFIRSCNRGRDITRLELELEKVNTALKSEKFKSDSLISSIKQKHYNDLDSIHTWITDKDRGSQLMELYEITKQMKSNAYNNK